MSSGVNRSGEIPRGGSAATFPVEILGLDAHVSLEVVVQHRDGDEDPWTDLVVFRGQSAPSIVTASAAGIRKVLAWKARISGPGTAVFRLLKPEWRL